MGVGWAGAPAAPAPFCLPRVDARPPSRLLAPFPVPFPPPPVLPAPAQGPVIRGAGGRAQPWREKKNRFLERVTSARDPPLDPVPRLPSPVSPPSSARTSGSHHRPPGVGAAAKCPRGCSSHCVSAPGLGGCVLSVPSHPLPLDTESEHQGRGTSVFLCAGIPEALARENSFPRGSQFLWALSAHLPLQLSPLAPCIPLCPAHGPQPREPPGFCAQVLTLKSCCR